MAVKSQCTRKPRCNLSVTIGTLPPESEVRFTRFLIRRYETRGTGKYIHAWADKIRRNGVISVMIYTFEKVETRSKHANVNTRKVEKYEAYEVQRSDGEAE